MIRVNGRDRIPDGMLPEVLSEVKNVASQSYTQQLKDYVAYAIAKGLRVELWLRPNTKVSGRLVQELANGNMTLRYIP